MKRKSDSKFNEYLTDVRTFFVENAAALGFNMTWFTSVFMPLFLAWVTDYNAWLPKKSRNQLITATKNASRKALEPEFSTMVNMVRDCPDVTDAQCEALGIPVGRGGGKPLDPPGVPPGIRLTTPAAGVIEIHISNSETGKKGKPRGGRGCLLGYIVLDASDEAPHSQDQMVMRIYISGGKAKLEFDRTMRGKIIYVSGRWMNTVGQHGPWSDIFSIAIP